MLLILMSVNQALSAVLTLTAANDFNQAQNVVISGIAPEYAGSVIEFYSIGNYFIDGELMMGECTVAANGDFSVKFFCDEAMTVYTRLGVFNVRLVVEPGFSYQVILPPRIDKTIEELESPFFEEAQVPMKIISVKDNKGNTVPTEKELNYKIFNFYYFFNQLYDQLAMDAARQCPPSLLDSCIMIFRENIERTHDSHLFDHTFYRSGLLYYAANRGGVRYISNEYFVHREVLYDNIAYMELFDATYDKFFMYFGRANNEIYNVINRQGSFSGLKHLLSQDLPTESLCELVILKNLHDEFYTDRFSRRALLNILDSAMVHSKIERHRYIAEGIRSKVTRLMRGYEPPNFSLLRHDSTLVSLNDYKGKYVYLMFCTTQNYSCLGQYKLLKELHKIHHGWLDIVVISVDDTFENMQYFKNQSGYLWDFLHYANTPNVLKSYDVRAFPSSFLIDPEGKLVLSPAPVPAPVYHPDASIIDLEKVLWKELNSRGLWHEYLRKGLIKY